MLWMRIDNQTWAPKAPTKDSDVLQDTRADQSHSVVSIIAESWPASLFALSLACRMAVLILAESAAHRRESEFSRAICITSRLCTHSICYGLRWETCFQACLLFCKSCSFCTSGCLKRARLVVQAPNLCSSVARLALATNTNKTRLIGIYVHKARRRAIMRLSDLIHQALVLRKDSFTAERAIWIFAIKISLISKPHLEIQLILLALEVFQDSREVLEFHRIVLGVKFNHLEAQAPPVLQLLHQEWHVFIYRQCYLRGQLSRD